MRVYECVYVGWCVSNAYVCVEGARRCSHGSASGYHLGAIHSTQELDTGGEKLLHNINRASGP